MNIDITNIASYTIYFAVFFVISVIGYHFLIKHKQLNLLKKKNETGERFASQSKPILGGTIFFLSLVLSYLFYTIYGIANDCLPDYTILICGTIAFIMGYIDDVKNYTPMFKLVFQILCAVILIANGVHVETSDNIFLNYSLTIFWVVGLMNSINMLDNMDGITTTTASIILVSLLGLSSGYHIGIILGITASLIAFLIWNWHPSKMYMGDNGSQLLGLLLAYFSIVYIWNSCDSIVGFNYEQLLFVCLTFIIPIIDTTTVAINRFLGGRSPFVGDRYHTTHCLVYSGLSIPKTVLLLDVISVIGCGITYFYISTTGGKLTHTETFIITLGFFVVFLVAYTMNLVIRKKNNLLYKHD